MLLTGIIFCAALILYIRSCKKECQFYELPRWAAVNLGALAAWVISTIRLMQLLAICEAPLEKESGLRYNPALYCVMAFFIVACLMIFVFLDCTPIYKLYKDWERISKSGAPRITYRLFKQMVVLHCNNFDAGFSNFYDHHIISLRYRKECFTLSFIGYVRAMWLVDRCGYLRKSNKAKDRLYNLMRDDLAKDAETVAKHKAAALNEIERGAKNSSDILARLENDFNKEVFYK